MTVTTETLSAVSESSLPRHLDLNGESGDVMQLEEWLEAQIRVACRATLEMLKAPRAMECDEDQLPHISKADEGTAYHLLMVHNHGLFHAKESYAEATQHPDVQVIIGDWVEHFGPLFNIMCKQNQIPYELSAGLVHNFQCRLVENIQHLRRIYELHSGGAILRSGVAWHSLEWANPLLITEDGVEFLRQSVYLPHVVREGNNTDLLLDNVHHTRESLLVRLSPYGDSRSQATYSESVDQKTVV